MAIPRARAGIGRRGAVNRADPTGRVNPQIVGPNFPRRRSFKFKWTKAVSEAEWSIYAEAIKTFRSIGVPFMLGGGFALAAFTGRWRDTKDIDFYILPEDRERVIPALLAAGFSDYFSERPYDRKWIYRSSKSGVIVDIIWSMANQRAQVDTVWFERAANLELRGERLLIIPPEELMWCKLYILQRDHCDWTDLFNLLYAAGPKLDWSHLLARLEEDTALLKALLQVYGWLCPNRIQQLPETLWQQLGICRPERGQKQKRNHIRLLDSRGWFAALQPPDRKLEV